MVGISGILVILVMMVVLFLSFCEWCVFDGNMISESLLLCKNLMGVLIVEGFGCC